MAASEEREKLLQLRALNAFLAKLTALDSDEKRLEAYVHVFDKLHYQVKRDQESWSSAECKNGDLGALVQKIANLHIGDPTHGTEPGEVDTIWTTRLFRGLLCVRGKESQRGRCGLRPSQKLPP